MGTYLKKKLNTNDSKRELVWPQKKLHSYYPVDNLKQEIQYSQMQVGVRVLLNMYPCQNYVFFRKETGMFDIYHEGH